MLILRTSNSEWAERHESLQSYESPEIKNNRKTNLMYRWLRKLALKRIVRISMTVCFR